MHVFAAWPYGKKQPFYTTYLIRMDFNLFSHVPCMFILYVIYQDIINYTIHKQESSLCRQNIDRGGI